MECPPSDSGPGTPSAPAPRRDRRRVGRLGRVHRRTAVSRGTVGRTDIRCCAPVTDQPGVSDVPGILFQVRAMEKGDSMASGLEIRRDGQTAGRRARGGLPVATSDRSCRAFPCGCIALASSRVIRFFPDMAYL